jgi:hypothetical protein
VARIRTLSLALVAIALGAPHAHAKGPGKATAVWERPAPTRAELKAQSTRTRSPKARALPAPQGTLPAPLGPVRIIPAPPLLPNGVMLPELQEALRQPNPPYRALLCAPLPRAQQADCLHGAR